MKYKSLYSIIQEFFKQKGIGINSKISTDICLSPYGDKCGPDILLITLVAEIKDKNEIKNQLEGYWDQWDNEKQKFGGKKQNFKISQCFNNKQCLEQLDKTTKGWIATIYGQLRHYTEAAKLEDGWLIVESSEDNKEKIDKLENALEFLKKEEKIRCYNVDNYKNLTFYRVWYNHWLTNKGLVPSRGTSARD